MTIKEDKAFSSLAVYHRQMRNKIYTCWDELSINIYTIPVYIKTTVLFDFKCFYLMTQDNHYYSYQEPPMRVLTRVVRPALNEF